MLRVSQVRKGSTYIYFCDIWQPFVLLLLAVGFTAGYFANSGFDSITGHRIFCNADGRVQTQSGVLYNPFWDPKLFLTINVAYGRFSFTTVKVIDAGWDVVIGKGGQVVAAIVAYPVLRRSLTLVMESCVIPIATTTSFYCRQIQAESVWSMIRFLFPFRDRKKALNRLNVLGKIRLAAHLLVCAYVLSFTTLASVMTGYRPELTGYFGYSESKISELKPVDNIYISQLGLLDGERVGFSPSPLALSARIGDYENVGMYLSVSSVFTDPWGILVDYHLTCNGLAYELSRLNYTGKAPVTTEFKCADHDCSCALPESDLDHIDARVLSRLTSNITINGKSWELSAPPLSTYMPAFSLRTPPFDISATNTTGFYLGTYYDSFATEDSTGDYWWPYRIYSNSLEPALGEMLLWKYAYNGTLITEDEITATGRCIADEAYSWGFSSLLLLTFCCLTILFAVTLIILQTDVHMNSGLYRHRQQHSIYRDILFLAKELRSRFDDDFEELPAKAIVNQVEADRDGITLRDGEFPCSRIQQWRKRSALHEGDTVTAERRITDWSHSGEALEQIRLRPIDGSKQGWVSEEQSLVEGSSDVQGHAAR